MTKTNHRERPTMRDVARRAEVSATTVAHVLNATPGTSIAAATRERVLAAAAALNYQRSLLGSAVKQPLRHLGLAVGRDSYDLEGGDQRLLAGIHEAALARHYLPVRLPVPAGVGQVDCSAAVARIDELFAARLLDGFLIDKQCFANVAVTELHARGIPLVTVNGSLEAVTRGGEPIPGVTIDTYLAGRQAVLHLAELGHRRIALLSRPLRRYPAAYRPMLVRRLVEGYRETLAACGLPVDPALLADGDPTSKDETLAALDRLLARPDPPSAFVMGDDIMAIMVLNALRERGQPVPAQASVVGCGDLPAASLLAAPALTTVRLPLFDCGALAANLLLDQLAGKPAAPSQQLLPTQLVVRASTGAPNRGRPPSAT